MTGIKRNFEQIIHKMLGTFPVLCLLGGRQVGKTTLCKQMLPTWQYFDLENPEDYNKIMLDPLFFFRNNPNHVIIDEAQRENKIFEVLRGIIDAQRDQKGRFILTGSSSPELLKNITESLAGRVGILELGTLKANEFYNQSLSKFFDLFQSSLNRKNVVQGSPPLSNQQMQKCWIKGGFPEPTLKLDNKQYKLWMDNFRSTYVNRDVASLFPKLNKIVYQRFIGMLGQLSGQILNKRALARALEVDEKTVKLYLDIAQGTFLWRMLPSFEKNVVKSIIKMPKGYMRDTGVLHHLMRIDSKEQIMQHPIISQSFEGFVIEEIIKGLQAAMIVNWEPFYYRTRNGAEIDLILEGSFGILPIEIKYGSEIRPNQLNSLKIFLQEHKLSFGLVINHAKEAYWLTEQIAVVPVGWL